MQNAQSSTAARGHAAQRCLCPILPLQRREKASPWTVQPALLQGLCVLESGSRKRPCQGYQQGRTPHMRSQWSAPHRHCDWLKTPKLRGKPGKWTESMSDQRLTHGLWLKLSSGRQNSYVFPQLALHLKLNVFSYKEIRPGYLCNQFVFPTTITTLPPISVSLSLSFKAKEKFQKYFGKQNHYLTKHMTSQRDPLT